MSETVKLNNAKKFVREMVERVSKTALMPAVGAGFTVDGKTVVTVTVGVRKWGTNHAVKENDLFPLGSIAKPLTGLLLARMIDDGKLNWSTTIGDIHPSLIKRISEREVLPNVTVPLPSAEWAPHYRDTTVVDLMTHTSGMGYAPSNTPEEQALALFDMPYGSTPGENLIAKRQMYTVLAMQDPPHEGEGWSAPAPPARPALYGGGCIVVASMLEKVVPQPWESLMIRYLFSPLDISDYSFGKMSKTGTVTNNWYHASGENGSLVPVADIRGSQVSYTHAPAGAVCMSMPALGKLLGTLSVNANGFLSHNTWAACVTPPVTSDGVTHAGWLGNRVIGHDGSDDRTYYATAWLDTNRGISAFACCTSLAKGVPQRLAEIRDELIAMAPAFDLFELLHEAIPSSSITVRANSAREKHGAALMNDAWFRTGWWASRVDPTVTIKLDRSRRIRGYVLFQPEVDTIDGMEVSFGEKPKIKKVGQDLGRAGLELGNMRRTSSNGHVLTVLFPKAISTERLEIRFHGGTKSPRINRLYLLKG